MWTDLSPVTWQAWGLVVLALILAIAVESDMRARRIPNLLVLLALLAGVLLHSIGPANGREGLLAAYPGALGAGLSLLGALSGLALFLPLYVLRTMGAGDVKLMAALGAFVGPVESVTLALCVLMAGGLLAVVRMLMKRNGVLVLTNIGWILGTDGMKGQERFDPALHSADRMPYALAFALGGVGYAWWRLSGGAALLV